MVYIIGTPRVYRKLVTEIDNKLRVGAVSSPIAYRETKDLPFLCAIIKEIFRIHPPIGFVNLNFEIFSQRNNLNSCRTPLPRTVPPQGVTICGHFLPGGCDVGKFTQIPMNGTPSRANVANENL